jgi:poly(A) polymerase
MNTTETVQSISGLPSSLTAHLEHAASVAHGQTAVEDSSRDPLSAAEVDELLHLSGATLRAHLDGVLLGKYADLGLEVLEHSGALQTLFPEFTGIMGLGDAENRHKDVWRHTKQVVVQSVPRVAVRWAALLHDIGKAKTRTITDAGRVQFLHHDAVGARMFDAAERRLRLFGDDKPLKERIRFLVLQHQRAHQYAESWTDSAVRRFARDMGDCLDDLLALSRADMTTKRKEKRRRYMFQLKELSDRIEALAAEDAKVPPLPKGLGEQIMVAFQIPPSKKIGDVRKALEECVVQGELPAQESIEYYVGFLKDHRVRFGI